MMRSVFAVAGTAAIGMLTLTGAPAHSPVAAAVSPLRARAVVRESRDPRTPSVRRNTSATGCSTTETQTTGNYAVGAVNGGDEADGTFSGVLAGASDQACDNDTAIGAGVRNVIGNGSEASAASFIGGGNSNEIFNAGSAFVGAGIYGSAEAAGAFVGAGGTEYQSSSGGTVGGGDVASGVDSFVGAGDLNVNSGNGSFIGAGDYAYARTAATAPGNQISGNDSFVGAGDQNTVAANGAFVGAGALNRIASTGTYGAIAGGYDSYLTGVYAAVGGGSGNKAEGAFATIPGGADNEALGAASFAAGYHAEAAHGGSFVWSDDSSGSALVADGAANEFVVRASGGTYVYSSENLSSGVHLAAGSGTWASLSDRNAKTDIVPLDDASILAKVDALPVDAWQYKTERGVRHVGPMAQDFYAAFGTGEDDRHITSIDEDGVALAAIKALHRENAALRSNFRTRTDRMQSQLAALATRDTELEHRLDVVVATLERRSARGR